MDARIALVLTSLAAPGLAWSSEIELQSRIDRVTVFPDAALVTRTARVELREAGAASLVLRGLPAAIDPASIRVEGEGSAPMAIGSVDVRSVPGDAKPVIDAGLEARIEALRTERDTVGVRVAAAEGKKAAIDRFAQAGPEKLSPESRPLEVEKWQSAWDAIGAALAGVGEEIRTLKARSRQLEAEIAALERARPQPRQPGAPKRDVAVALEAEAALSGDIRVTYRVGGASWTPVYDARLETGAKDRKASLDLVRRAQVTQRTGEDWTDVALAVSTVRVAQGTTAPDLAPLQVAFYEPPFVLARRAPAARASRGFAADSTPNEQAMAKAAAPPAQPAPGSVAATESEAGVEAGSFQATFVVPGRVSVPQDGSSKNLALGRRTLEPNLVVTVAPAVDETAYLQASFTNEEAAPLLPGSVSVHRDGVFVGRSRLKLVASGDAVDLGFGADDQVKVTRVPVRRRENEPTSPNQTKTELRDFKTTVKNLHARPMRITLLDRLPFSENTAIAVEQLKDTTPPTEKQVNDRRGVMAWAYDYGPGETRDIRLAYRMRWPADRDVTLEPAPNPRADPNARF